MNQLAKKTFRLAIAIILLGTLRSPAQDAPYVASYETDNFFSTITSNEMNVLRTKKILFLSRSFGLNMMDGLARMEAYNPMYDFNSSYIRYDVMNNGLGIVETNAFSNYNLVHCMATYWPHTQRLQELNSLLRDPPFEFGKQVDVVMVYYHTATPALFPTYTNVMDSLRADFPNIKFIYVTSGLSGPQYYNDNTNSAAFGALVRTKYKNQVPLYDLGYILSNDGECGEVCCPDYIVDPTGLHPDAAAGEERMGKAFLLMLRDLYFGSGCTNLAPPTVPAGFSGTALSESSIKLAWEPAVHECGIARYEVTRNGTFLAATTKTNYTDTGLTENTSYGYAVRAVSMAEAVSSYSSTATISTLPDSLAPTIVSSEAISASQVSIVFSENLNVVSAQTAANYSLNYGVSVLSASVSGHVVTLSTSPMSDGTNYTLTISNVTDNSSAKNPVAPGTQTFFTYIANTYPDSPTAWWKFDRTLDDASGNSLTGTWKNSTGTFTNALLGQGVSLTGGSTGSYVHVVHNNLLDGMTNGMSISIWAKKQTAAIGGELFKKHVVYHLNISSNTVAGYVFAGGSSKYFSVSSVSDINNTNWHHYCMVYNGSNITVHVDGTQRGTYPLTGAVANVITQPLYIGYDPFGGPMVFNGQLDEMKIFRRVLSTNEIYGLYANGLAGSADRQAVRNILDSNNLTNKQVDAISVYENDRIIKLYLQESGVSSIPADIGQLSKLKLLHCYGDRNLGFPLLTQIAPEIGNCTRINELLLAQNDLSELPATLTNLTALTTCSIGDNLLCNANPAWESWADTYDPDWWTTQNCGDAPVIHPVLTSFGRGQDVISWIPGPGHVYHVYYSTNLQQGFQPLETNLPDTVQSLTNTISAPSVFYKIEAR